ncbi:MAG: TetR/AcrR family transcriptional regulator [Rhodospirillales bacterium]|nr:TetR/AcrR family transcriptional regulator [Rhodospirillales bacterium]
MKKNGEDRRTAKTRASLHQALISLILRKGYDSVTVQDIIDEANVGRSTFYSHYTGKEDLFRKGFDSLRQLLGEHQNRALRSRAGVKDRILAFSRPMFEHAADHKEVYQALVGNRGGMVALYQIQRFLTELVRADLTATLGADKSNTGQRELVIQFVVGAFMAVLTWWLDHKARIPPERIDAWFRSMAMESILSIG